MMKVPWLSLTALLLILSSGDCDAQQEFQLSLLQLTTHPGVDYYPSWSPQGDYIVFSSDRSGGHLWRVPSGGGVPVQITDSNANHPSWSPEGSFIAFDSDQGTRVKIIPPDGGVAVSIVPGSIAISRGAHPIWSPNGYKVAFSAQGAIWTLDLPTGELSSVFQRDGFYARVFSWAADGSYFTADMDTSEQNSEDDIWLLYTDGREPRRLTDAPGREGNPHLSPDESMIAYMDDRGASRDLWVIRRDGDAQVRITWYEGFNANPRWSPDGRRIAFSSDRGGSPDIWVMELDIERLRRALGLN